MESSKKLQSKRSTSRNKSKSCKKKLQISDHLPFIPRQTFKERKHSKHITFSSLITKPILKQEEKELTIQRQYSRVQIFEANQKKRIQLESLTSVGTHAKNNYFDNYHQLDKISENNKFNNLEDSAFTAYLNKLKELKIPPQPLGIVRRKGEETEIQIPSIRMGDNYAKALTVSLKHIPKIETLNLKNNRLSDKAVSDILQSLNYREVVQLDLAQNRLGQNTITQIGKIVAGQQTKLQILKLQGCSLQDSQIKILCESLEGNNSLKILELGKNQLGKQAGLYLASYLESQNNLQELDLH